MSTRLIYLVRHAQCGMPGTLLGAANPSLTAEGRADSAEVARQLRSEEIGRIVSSALRRARETAEIMAAELKLAVDIDERLNEISYGPWDGLTWEQIEARYPADAAKKLDDWLHFTPAGAEPFAAFLERLKLAWRLIAGHPAPRTAVVTHQAVNAVLFALSEYPELSSGDLRGLAGDRIYRFEQPQAAIVTVRIAESSPSPGG